ncbi:putative cupredoxin-like copper-binding protein [Bradyrhizobium sp. USDA 4354]
MTDPSDFADVGGFASVINSRLAAEAKIAKAIGFGWFCGGWAIALCLVGLGGLFAFWGYSSTQSVASSADDVAAAIGQALSKATIHTSVEGQVSLAPDASLTLAPSQTVKLAEGTTVSLDPNASVKVTGDFKVDVPQPSKQQLQLDATSSSNESPFTQYTVFKGLSFGGGYVITGWNFDLSDTSKPNYQRCYYEQDLDEGVAATQTIAINGLPRPLSSLAKLPFDFDGAVANCIWFSG